MRAQFVAMRLLPALGVLVEACGSQPTTSAPPPPTVATVTVSGPATIQSGETAQFTAVTKDASGTVLKGRTITWTSTATGVASISTGGMVTAIAVGTTTITATSEGKSGSTALTVAPIAVAAVAAVELSSTALSLQIGQMQQLTATTKDATGNILVGRTITWSSSNPAAGTVSLTGLVTAVASGITTVTATSEGKSASAMVTVTAPSITPFTLDRELNGPAGTLSLQVLSVDAATREVLVGGADSRAPTTPFTFDWGDGVVTSGFFNQSHTYASASRNYFVRVTAHYGGSETDYLEVPVRFVAPLIVRKPFPLALEVTIPAQTPSLTTRQPGYTPPGALVAFDDSCFGAAVVRADVAYVLSQAATIEYSLLEGDVELVLGGFPQVVLRDPNFGGAYSLWYTTPVAFGANGAFLQGTPGYSSFFHEMGHNVSGNAPAAFRFGGRIDGNANAVFGEAVAQMFQHTVAIELVNHRDTYGLPDDLALDIANSARASARLVRTTFDTYVAQGKPFSTWNDPVTPSDETFGAFMVLARQFLVHADNAHSYVVPLTRTMRLLRTFNQNMLTQYAPQTNSPEASTYRATLMVAALSYGFQQDLRAEFRALAFPIDDVAFTALVNSMP